MKKLFYYDKNMGMAVFADLICISGRIGKFFTSFYIIRFANNKTEAKWVYQFAGGVARDLDRLDYSWSMFFSLGILGKDIIHFKRQIPKRFYSKQLVEWQKAHPEFLRFSQHN